MKLGRNFESEIEKLEPRGLTSFLEKKYVYIAHHSPGTLTPGWRCRRVPLAAGVRSR